MICVFGRPFSRRIRVDAAQLAEAAHIVGDVLHPDLGPGPHQADGAHQGAAHVVGLRTEDMLDANPPISPACGFGPVGSPGLFGQRLAALALAVDVAFQLPVAQLGRHLLGPASRIRR